MPQVSDHTSPTERLIIQEIERFGPMDFFRFIDIALYHPKYGYYQKAGPKRGRQGDYFTSAQASSIWPEIFASLFLEMKAELGTESFYLIEMGAGDGEFLEGILKELERRKITAGFKTVAVERSASAREGLRRRLSRFPKCEVVPNLDEMEWVGGAEGCFFSNEFFDALPFHRLLFRGGQWRELMVDCKNGILQEVEGPLSRPDLLGHIDGAQIEFTEGAEIEIRPQLKSVWEEIGTFFNRGFVVTVDYGYPRRELFAEHHHGGTALCYHKHQAHDDLLKWVGEQDITAHVDFTQLAELGRGEGFEPAFFSSQGVFLSHAGKEVIGKALESASEPLKRKLAGALQQILHPQGMGEAFSVLVHTKDCPLPLSLTGAPNRAPRLSW